MKLKICLTLTVLVRANLGFAQIAGEAPTANISRIVREYGVATGQSDVLEQVLQTHDWLDSYSPQFIHWDSDADAKTALDAARACLEKFGADIRSAKVTPSGAGHHSFVINYSG